MTACSNQDRSFPDSVRSTTSSRLLVAADPPDRGRLAADPRHPEADAATRSPASPPTAWRGAASSRRCRSPMRCSSWRPSARSASCFGLFTRVFAAAIGVQFLLIIFNAHWGKGFADFPWNRPGGGWEYPLFWASDHRGDRTARRRPLLARPQARPRALRRELRASWPRRARSGASGRPDPDLVVVERRAAIGRDRVGAGQRVDAAAVGIGVVRPDRFRDQHAAAHAVEQRARAGAPAPRVLPSTTAAPSAMPSARRIVGMDHHLGPAAVLRARASASR